MTEPNETTEPNEPTERTGAARPGTAGPAAIDGTERRGRVTRLQVELRARGLDGLLVTERANFEYLAGYVVGPLWSSFTRVLAALVPADGAPTLLLPGFIADEAHVASGWAVERYESLQAEAANLFADLLRTAGLANTRIGLELGRESRFTAPAAALSALRDLLPDATFEDGTAATWAVRAIKSRGEIDRLRIACEANRAGFAAGFGRTRAGATEWSVAAEMFAAGTTAGAALGAWVQPGWVGMTSGSDGYGRFVSGPRDRTLERGDMLWADLGFTADGYWSDYCRAAVVGGATPQQVDRQRRITEATAAGVAMCRPGVAIADIAREVRRTSEHLGLAGLGFGRLGHGIGLNATEPPSVVEHDSTILERGMVITIEPAATYEDGLYCAEQIVVVGDQPELLSVEPSELRSI